MQPKLKAKQVEHLTTPGRYPDGGNLYFQVRSATSRSWLFRYMRDGTSHAMGLGKYPEVSLAQARNMAMQCRDHLARGVDPMEARKAVEALAVRNRTTFRDAIETCLTMISHGWNPKQALAWRHSLLRDHIPMSILDLPVAAITTERVRAVLEPIWEKKTPTASNVRMRIERVLAFAIGRGWHDGPNPALWRGNLRDMLPLPTKVHKETSHVAVPWRVIPGVYQRVMAEDTIGRCALAFVILNAARVSMVLDAPWHEIDFDEAVWTIPAERMKTGRTFRVPLSEPALAILRHLRPLARSRDDLIFPGLIRGRALSITTPRSLLRAISGIADADTHGLRATFRTWATDKRQDEFATEAALAHVIGNKTRGAYDRSDWVDVRRPLMDEWAAFLTSPPAVVVPMRPVRQAA